MLRRCEMDVRRQRAQVFFCASAWWDGVNVFSCRRHLESQKGSMHDLTVSLAQVQLPPSGGTGVLAT